MSRSGYTDDVEDQWALIRWRGAVASSIRGARGQAFLQELLAALDSLPEKRLIANNLQAEGAFCTLGALGAARGLDMAHIDPEDRDAVASSFGVAEALAADVMYLNDEWIDEYVWVDVEVCGPLRYRDQRMKSVRMQAAQVEEKRWRYMREWVASQIKASNASA